MSSARPPSGTGSSPFLSSLSAANRLNGPKESTSLGCRVRRSFIRVVLALTSETGLLCKAEVLPGSTDALVPNALVHSSAQPASLQCDQTRESETAKLANA